MSIGARARSATLAAALTVVLGAGRAHAAPLRVLLVGADRDGAVIARVEGQVADLAAVLEREPAALPAASMPDQLAAARRQARAHGVDVVVWFARDGTDWIVYVADAAGARLLVRRVDSGTGALSDSAAIEAAAVVVRTAVRALAAGGELGVVVAPVAPRPLVPIAPRPLIPSAPRLDAERAAVRPYASVQLVAVVDGATAVGQAGVGASLGLSRDGWRGAVDLAYLPAVTLTGAEATIEVERQALAVTVGHDTTPARHPRWRLGGALALGAARFIRTTTSTRAPAQATVDAARWSATVTPTLAVAWRLGRGAWLALDVGAVVVTGAPEFAVATPSGFSTFARMWPVEPRVSLGVVVAPF